METKKIGITGGIGSGKSLICKVFGLYGIPSYDADTAAKRLVEHKATLKKSIVDLLGEDAYDADGRYNRSFVAEKVFADKALLSQLNGLVHPAVSEDYLAWHEAQEAPFTLKEAALLVETGSWRALDALIVVSADEAVRAERVARRDQRSKEDIARIMNNQATEAERLEKADFVVDNSGTSAVLPVCWGIYQQLRAGNLPGRDKKANFVL